MTDCEVYCIRTDYWGLTKTRGTEETGEEVLMREDWRY